jgi:hypothetical protein
VYIYYCTVRIDRTPQLSNPSEVRLYTSFYHSTNQSSPPQSTHRVAIADFWRTSHHDQKNQPWLVRVGGARPPPCNLLPSRTKLQCTLLLREKIHSLHFISTLFVLFAPPPGSSEARQDAGVPRHSNHKPLWTQSTVLAADSVRHVEIAEVSWTSGIYVAKFMTKTGHL